MRESITGSRIFYKNRQKRARKEACFLEQFSVK